MNFLRRHALLAEVLYDYSNFNVVHFLSLYGVYVSQLIRYNSACSNYQDFVERGKVLTTKLLSQGYKKKKQTKKKKKKKKKKTGSNT